jgi:hypothetical protein
MTVEAVGLPELCESLHVFAKELGVAHEFALPIPIESNELNPGFVNAGLVIEVVVSDLKVIKHLKHFQDVLRLGGRDAVAEPLDGVVVVVFVALLIDLGEPFIVILITRVERGEDLELIVELQPLQLRKLHSNSPGGLISSGHEGLLMRRPALMP